MRLPTKRDWNGGGSTRRLGPGRYLCVVVDVAPPKAGSTPFIGVTFEEIVRQGQGGQVRDFVSLDGNLMPSEGMCGQGRWARILNGLAIPESEDDVDLKDLLLRGAWVTVGTYQSKQGKEKTGVTALEPCSAEDEDAIMAYLARTRPQ